MQMITQGTLPGRIETEGQAPKPGKWLEQEQREHKLNNTENALSCEQVGRTEAVTVQPKGEHKTPNVRKIQDGGSAEVNT